MISLEKFKNLGLSPETLQALKKRGFEEPTPIQEKTIPLLLENTIDVIAQAQTGTGKTAAFGLPLIEKLDARSKHVKALILAPTRELAIQVAEEINSLKGNKKLQIVPIYGGQSIDQQLRSLNKGVDIVVGTPGRIIDHINRKSLSLNSVSYVILDEADEMLNMGFIDDIESILSSTPEDKRMLLFSATMPKRIMSLAAKFMGKYETITVKNEQLTTKLTDQIYFEVASSDKFEALCRIVDIEESFYGLIFCRTKVDVDMLTRKLSDRGYDAEGLHGDISQNMRERILQKFKKRRANILVATDVAARGIDINNLSHVINYSLPQDPESYVHRIGRTGRAGKEGTAITFVTPDEYRQMIFIKRIAKTEIRKEQLPDIRNIISIKKTRIKDIIGKRIEKEVGTSYATFASELLQEHTPEELVGSLLQLAFQADLDEKSYREIKKVTIDAKGTTRLFVAMGRNDKMTPRALVDFILKEAAVEQHKINDVRIFDEFSFITVPFEEAEIILDVFKKQKRGRRPMVERAKEKRNAPGSGAPTSRGPRGNYRSSSDHRGGHRSSNRGSRDSGRQSKSSSNYGRGRSNRNR